MKFIIDIPAAAGIGIALFLLITTRFPQERFEPAVPAQIQITGPTPADVRQAIDSGRAELHTAARRFDAAAKKIIVVSPHFGERELSHQNK